MKVNFVVCRVQWRGRINMDIGLEKSLTPILGPVLG